MTEAETTTADDSEQAQEYVCDDCGATFDVQQEYASHRNQCDEGDESDDSSDDEAAEETTRNRGTGFETIIKASAFDPFINYLNAVVEECRMHFRPGGITTQAVDPANVCMVTANLGEPAWESYDNDQEYTLGVNLERLSDVLKQANDDDLVFLDYDHQRRNLEVQYREHKFTLTTIDPDSIRKEPDVPDLDLTAHLSMDAREIDTCVKFVDQVTDHIRFETKPHDGDNPETFTITGEGDIDQYEASFTPDDGIEFINVPTEQERVLISLDYMQEVIKPFPAHRRIELRHGTDFPFMLFGDIVVNEDTDDPLTAGRIQYMIAPRIESE